MFTKEELQGLYFEGFFQRDPKLASESRQHTEKIRVEKPELYEKREKICHAINDPYPFSMQILEYNVDSKMFIARARDHFGDSGLVGTIHNGKLSFMKNYADLKRFRNHSGGSIKYEGDIVQPDNVITCGGSYHMVGVSENYDGVWRLDSVPNAKISVAESLPMHVNIPKELRLEIINVGRK